LANSLIKIQNLKNSLYSGYITSSLNNKVISPVGGSIFSLNAMSKDKKNEFSVGSNISNSINPMSVLFSDIKNNINLLQDQSVSNLKNMDKTKSLISNEGSTENKIKRINYNRDIQNISWPQNNYSLIENASSLLLDNIQKHTKVILNPTSPAKITGIKIRLAGRIDTERLKPKKTVQTFQLGSLSKDLTNIVNTAEFISKNKRGSFNIKV
jgi:thiamine biosynthesis lipoprotein ApbE